MGPFSSADDSASTSLSEFEKFFQQRVASPAYPFTALLDQLSEGDARGAVPSFIGSSLHNGFYLQIPDGRSLQRKEANFKDPREVASFNSFSAEAHQGSRLKEASDQIKGDLHDLGLPSLFIGHATRVGKLEIISWNADARRYEFLIVEDFVPGKLPRIYRADREVCLACHQAGGPIFSRGDWSEVGQLNPSIDERILERTRVSSTEFAIR